MDTVICLPTYNEAENIPYTVDAIREIMPNALILVIDDNSPDGTGTIAENLARHDPLIRVRHRAQKQGLGKAYLDGFRYVLDHFDVRNIVQMDADLSHPPQCIPTMIQWLDTADLVIGSRYVAGGGTRNWNLMRKMISRFGSLYARAWLGIPINDLTGGFKAWRRQLLQKVIDYPISASGYVFQVETTWISWRLGARIVESPIVFTDRGIGQSKMSLAIALEACLRVPGLRFKGDPKLSHTLY